MIATFDANLLASGPVAAEGGTIASIIEAWRMGRLEVALSEHIYDELVRTLAQPYFTSRVSPDAIARYLAFVLRSATFYAITVPSLPWRHTPKMTMCSHPPCRLEPTIS